MFERFNADSIQIIMNAQGEGRRLGHEAVGTGMILRAIVQAGGPFGEVLKRAGLLPGKTRLAVEHVLGRGQAAPVEDMPFTPAARNALQWAFDEGSKQPPGHQVVTPPLLLLGLLASGSAHLPRILQEVGVEPGRLQATVATLLDGRE